MTGTHAASQAVTSVSMSAQSLEILAIGFLIAAGLFAWFVLARARGLRAWQKRQATREERMTLREFIIEKTPLHTVGLQAMNASTLRVTGTYTGDGFLFKGVHLDVPRRDTREAIVEEINAEIQHQNRELTS